MSRVITKMGGVGRGIDFTTLSSISQSVIGIHCHTRALQNIELLVNELLFLARTRRNWYGQRIATLHKKMSNEFQRQAYHRQ